MPFMLFLTTPEVWTPGNKQIIGISLQTKFLCDIKRRDSLIWGFFLGALWFSSRNIQEHSYSATHLMAPWSCLNSIPKFQFSNSRWCSLKSPELWKWSVFLQKSPLTFPPHFPSRNLGILFKAGNKSGVWWTTKVGFSSKNDHKHNYNQEIPLFPIFQERFWGCSCSCSQNCILVYLWEKLPNRSPYKQNWLLD